LTLICDIFSLLIPTYLHFSWVRKPILDRCQDLLDDVTLDGRFGCSPFSHIFMLQAYFHMCQMPAYSIPANLGRGNILKPHIVLGPRYYHVCSMCAGQHICSPTRSGPANRDKIYGHSKLPAAIYVGLLGVVQPTTLQYMGTPSVPADIYAGPL